MKKKVYKSIGLILAILLWVNLQSLQAAEIIVTNAHSPLIGDQQCKCNPVDCDTCPDPCGRQYIYQAFDVSLDVAFNGSGAQNAVVSGTISGTSTDGCPFSLIHRPEFINDGYYGNGSSWIATSNPWLKIDLGRLIPINKIMFGRERIVTNEGPLNDRDPGRFIIYIAESENSYTNGDESNDDNEYREIVDSEDFGFSGLINGPETVEVIFEPVTARYVKIRFFNSGVAIDEVEVMMAQRSLSCIGFENPFVMPLELKRNVKRTIPLKIQLIDGNVTVTDSDVAAPLVDVYFTPEIAGNYYLEDDLLLLGYSNEGNKFRYDENNQHWIFNLSTKKYSTPGTYIVTVKPGDDSYNIDPTCEQYFIRLP